MNCERCQGSSAVVHITEIKDNKKRVINLCQKCAMEMQSGGFGFLPQLNLHNFLAGLFSDSKTSFTPHQATGSKCSTCGLMEGQFIATGLLGCGDCYNHFGESLNPIYRRIHGTTKHIGKVPVRSGARIKLSKEIKKLKLKLQESINNEEFEEAARLRDEIKDFEKSLDKGED